MNIQTSHLLEITTDNCEGERGVFWKYYFILYLKYFLKSIYFIIFKILLKCILFDIFKILLKSILHNTGCIRLSVYRWRNTFWAECMSYGHGNLLVCTGIRRPRSRGRHATEESGGDCKTSTGSTRFLWATSTIWETRARILRGRVWTKYVGNKYTVSYRLIFCVVKLTKA